MAWGHYWGVDVWAHQGAHGLRACSAAHCGECRSIIFWHGCVNSTCTLSLSMCSSLIALLSSSYKLLEIIESCRPIRSLIEKKNLLVLLKVNARPTKTFKMALRLPRCSKLFDQLLMCHPLYYLVQHLLHQSGMRQYLVQVHAECAAAKSQPHLKVLSQSSSICGSYHKYRPHWD